MEIHPEQYRVGDLQIDLARRHVSRDGRELRLGKLTFDLLAALVRAAPDPVSADVLLKSVWAGTVVERETVSQRIKRLRTALGDNAGTPRYISSSRGFGYRVIVPVAPVSEERPPEGVRRRIYLRRAGLAGAFLVALITIGAWIRVHAPLPQTSIAASRETQDGRRAPDPNTYRLYGRAGATPISEQGLRHALVLLDDVLARDPQFAPGLAARAEVRTGLALLGHATPEGFQDAERDARRALALQPGLVEANAVLGIASAYRGDWAGAAAVFRSILAAHTDQAGVRAEYATFVLQSAGHTTQALEQLIQAYREDPTSPAILALLAAEESLMDRTADARKFADLAADSGYPSTTAPLAQILSGTAARAGDVEEAAQLAAAGLPESVRHTGTAAARLFYSALAKPSRRAAARRALVALVSKLDLQKLDMGTRQQLICWLAQTGALESAYSLANSTLDQLAQQGGVGNTWGILWSPQMRAFRLDPRFGSLVSRLRLQDDWDRNGPPDGCTLRQGGITCA
jgi:DNA-binding winged helix-turn-helix (wHTH) protein/tetratricopeptide (TPR) repeat protein